MASEKLWDAVAPVSFTADGGPTGLIKVTDTIGFYYGMACTIKNNTQQITVFVKGVLSNTMMLVGSSKGNPDSNVNLTAFTIASGSQISAAAQNKPSIPMESRLLATYMTDPINAWRTFNVDPYGKPYTDSNPVPVAFSGSISIANVGIIGPGPENNRLEVNTDGSAQITGAGTAGTSDPGVVTVQGIAGGTPLPISGSITATNPSVSDTGIAPPAQATFIGTLVSAIAPTYADGTLQSPSLTLAGALRVDGSGVTQPISAISLPLPSGAATNSELVTINTTLGSPFQAGGSIGNTSFGATQSGTWNVGLNAGSNAIGSVTVSNFPASQPVSGTVTVVQPSGSALHVDVDSLPSLPAGANAIGSVSVSNFPSLQDITGTGTAGSPAPGVVTIQGIASGTPIPISGSITASNPSVTPTGTTPPAQVTFVGALVSAIAPAYIDGNVEPPSMTLAGALRVDGSAVTQPISATSLPLPTGAATNAELVTINTTLGSPFQAGGSIGNTSFGSSQVGTWNVGLNAGSNNIGSITNITGTVSLPTGAATNAELVTINSTLGSPFQAGGSIGNTSFGSSQIGTWNVGRTWTLNSATDSVTITGSITATNLSIGPTGIAPPADATYIGVLVNSVAPVYIDGEMQSLSLTTAAALRVDGSAVTQPISATSLPLPTGAATNAELVTINTTLGSPFQAGGSIGNTSFGSSQVGTWNVGLNAGTNVIGSIANTSFASTQSGTWNVGLNAGTNNIGSITNITGTISLPTGAATNSELVTINTTLGSPFQAGGSIGNTSFGSSQVGTWTTGRTWTLNSATDSVTVTGTVTATNPSVSATGTTPPADATYIGALAAASSPSLTAGDMYSLSLTLAGALRTDSSATTQPISATSLPLPTGAATNAELVTINTTLGTPFQAGGSIGNTSFGSSQVGTWTVQPGNTANTTPWLVTVATALPAGTNAIGSITNTSFIATQTTAANLNATVVGTGTFAVQSAQSGTWTVGLSAGANNIGSITNITGTVSLPTGAATNAELVTINTTLGSPFQAGGSIGNTSFGSSQVGTWTTGRTWTLNSGTDSVTVTGTVTATNPSVSATGTTPPADATYAGALASASSPSLTAGNMYALSLTLAGALRTDSSATTQPISATSLPLPTGAATNSELVTINTTLGSPFQAGGSIGNTSFGSTQVGTWTVQPGNTANTTPWLVTVATALPAGTNAIGSITNTSFIATQATAANLNATVVGTGTFAVQSAQSGTWNVGLNAGSNNIGSITNITGTVSLPTGAATNAELVTINTTLGSPFQAGGSIGNTSFGSTQVGTWTTGRTWNLNSATDSVAVTGTVTATNLSIGATGTTPPADATYAGALAAASSPSLTAGNMYSLSLTLAGALRVDGSAVTQPISAVSLPLPSGAATNAELITINTTLGTPFQAGGSIGNTSFGSSQVGTWTVQPGNTANTTPWLVTVATALPAGANVIGSIANTSFIATQATAANLNATVVGTGTFAVQAAQSGTWNVGLNAGTNNIGSITNITGTVSLPTGASTAALQTTGNTSLATIASAVLTQSSTTSGQVGFLHMGAVSASSPSYTAGNTNPLSLTLAGALRVDGSAVTQPISATSLPLPTGAATNAELVTINTTLGSPFQAGGSIGNTSFGSSQVGTWTVQPGNTANTTPWLVTVATALPAGSNVIGSIANTSFIATQATAANLNATVVGTGTFAVQSAQSGTWTTGRTWTLASGTDSVSAVQSGTWNVGLNAGTNLIGSVNQGTSPWVVKDQADGTPGSAAPTTAIQIGGTDGTNLRTLSVNPVGAAKVTYGPGTQDVFGTIVTGSRQLQINVQFNTGVIGQLVQYLTGAGGTATITSNGQAQFSTSTTTGSESTGISLSTTQYASGCEIYSEFTAAFTAPVAGTYQKIGLYNSTTGFYVGYIGTNFGVTLRALSTDTTVNQSSFNIDTLTGASNSLFTNAGVPVAINFTYINVFRIRFGWLGAAPVYFEVLSPDGNWVTFHIIRQPNSATIPSIENPNLPITIDVSNGSTTSNMVITTACWGAGIVSPNTSQDLISYGSLSSTSGSVFLSGLNGAGSANVDVGGTFVGTLTVSESGQLNAKTLYLQNLANGALQTTITAPGNYRVVGVPATTQIAVNFTAYTSGTAEISIRSASSTYFTSPISLNPTNMLVTSYLNDGSGNAINSINSQLETADIINTALTVPTSLSLPTPGTAVAARVGSSNLANRKGIIIAPITATVYWGSTASVTAATGIPIYPGQVVELTYGPNITIYLVSSVVNTVNIVEES